MPSAPPPAPTRPRSSSARASRFDLLITDIVMPGRNGVELARALNRTHPDVKVLFTTGYTRHIAPDLLADSEILDKPYQRAALLHAVRHVLGAKAPQTLA